MNFKFSKNDGKKKNIPQLKKESSNSFCKTDSFKKKTKKIDSFIWGKVLNTMASWGKHYVFQVQSKTKTSDKAGRSLVGTTFGGCSS